MRLLLAVALCTVVASSALAQDAPAPAKPEKEKKICRRIDDTGSIVPKRVCHTQSEWAVIDAQNEKGAGEAFNQMRPNGAPMEH
jgi:hypothetical protein